MVGLEHFKPEEHFAPRQAPAQLSLIAKVLTAVGVVSLLAGLFMEGYGVRIRGAFLVNLIYFGGISFGAMAFLAAQQITLARWSRPLRRFAESFAVFAPVAWVLLILFFATGGLDLYEWHHDPASVEHYAHKSVWLQAPFFVGRQALMLGVLTLLGLTFIRNSLRPDLGLAARALGDKAPAWWARLTDGYGDQATEVAEAHRKMQTLAPLMGVAFAIGMSFFAFDVIMSLAPHWYANMFGGFFFMSCFWIAMVWIALTSMHYRGWLGIERLLRPATYHDLGKLIFGFTMFWAYTTYAQLLAIWYGNMTEEIGFLMVRLSLEPWTNLAKVVGAMCFLIPFTTLLSRGIKKLSTGFSLVLGIIVVGVWLERLLMAVPSFWMEPSIPIGPLELGVTAGFLGGFLWVSTRYLSSVPAVPVSDPYMRPHPDDVHVASLDAAHAHH